MLSVYKRVPYKYFEAYFGTLLPRDQEIDPKDIDRLEKIKTDYLKSDEGKLAGANDGFIKEVQGGIDALKRSKDIRDFSEADK